MVVCHPGITDVAKSMDTIVCTESTSGVAKPARTKDTSSKRCHAFALPPAEKAGVKTGDVILKFNDIEIESMKELPKVVAGTPVGKSVPIVILRNGKELTLNVVLGELELAEKENLIGQANNSGSDSKEYEKLGFVAEELNSSNKSKFNIKDVDKGIVITSVKEESPAQAAGIVAGMVIVRVGQVEVNSLSVIDQALQSAIKQKRKALLFLVKVENGTRFVAIELK